jgi:adenosylcobinamide kinase/adenosylcobinamide-phosphate guanylyltransferase
LTSKITFVIGGCRSGKSRHALKLAESRQKTPRIYVATCRPEDDEMRRRVAAHQSERGDRWITEEVPIRLGQALSDLRQTAGIVLVDCLTLWVSNLMMASSAPDAVAGATGELVSALGPEGCPVVVVSNEVGAGIVPENRLARRYRDAVGFVNQKVAACADHVVLMVAGIPVAVKGNAGP